MSQRKAARPLWLRLSSTRPATAISTIKQAAPWDAGSLKTESVRENRSSMTALVWRMGGVDFEAFSRWSHAHPVEAAAFRENLNKIAGYRTSFFPAGSNEVVWWNNWITNRDCSNLDDIRYTEFLVRNSVRSLIEFCRKNMPYGKNAYIYDIAPQLGSPAAPAA